MVLTTIYIRTCLGFLLYCTYVLGYTSTEETAFTHLRIVEVVSLKFCYLLCLFQFEAKISDCNFKPFTLHLFEYRSDSVSLFALC